MLLMYSCSAFIFTVIDYLISLQFIHVTVDSIWAVSYLLLIRIKGAVNVLIDSFVHIHSSFFRIYT